MNDILAVLVLYKCHLEDSDSFKSLNNSLEEANCGMDILVFDNSPFSSETRNEFVKGRMRVIYVNDISNPGVSAAYNKGAEVARSLGKKWLLLLDQDTYFPLDAIDRYKNCSFEKNLIYAPMLVSGNVFLSPCRFILGRGEALKSCVTGMHLFKNESLLNSGLMISLDLFDRAGGYNERMPLDFSDHDFINRVKLYCNTFNVLDIKCTHSLSCEEQDLSKVLIRFKFYLVGAREYMRCHGIFPILWVSLGRTVRLSLKFRSVMFFKYFFKSSR